MLGRNPQQLQNLLDLARSLKPISQQILFSLSEHGSSLLFELAVSILKFPEEIGESVLELRAAGLIEATAISGSQFGSEVLSLSERGREVVRLLREEKQQPEAHSMPRSAQVESAGNVRQEEIDLLRKLGDAAAHQGDWQKASEWYEKALDATRKTTNS